MLGGVADPCLVFGDVRVKVCGSSCRESTSSSLLCSDVEVAVLLNDDFRDAPPTSSATYVRTQRKHVHTATEMNGNETS